MLGPLVFQPTKEHVKVFADLARHAALVRHCYNESSYMSLARAWLGTQRAVSTLASQQPGSHLGSAGFRDSAS